jgi:hypothetical protein
MIGTFTESTVEQVALAWLEGTGWQVAHGPGVAPDMAAGHRLVDELGFYSLGAKQLAEKIGLTMPKAVAVVDHLGLRGQTECYKEIKSGKAVFKRYSQKAIDSIKEALKKESADEIWRKRTVKAKGATR